MSFPLSPTNGQTAVVNGINYQYNSTTTAWTRIQASYSRTTTSATAPTTPTPIAGDQWYNTTNDTLYRYTFDGVASYWVDITGASSTTTVGQAQTYLGETTVTGNITPTSNAAYSLGSNTRYFSNLYVVNNFVVNSTISGSANITAATASTSTTTGALTVAGGVGIGGNLYIGGYIFGNAAPGGITSNAVGYIGLPQNSQSNNYTLALADQGEQIYVTNNANITIPANTTTAFPIGATINLITGPSSTANVLINTDTLYLAGIGTTGTRTLSTYAMATLVKTTATTWYIGGTGVS